MQRRTLLLWIVIIAAGLFLISYFNEPVEEVLLSFDVEPINTEEQVDFIVSTLEQYDAQATFFVTGEFAQQHPALVKELAEEYEVGCHTMTHPRLPQLNESALRWELEECKRVVENITAEPVIGFRAPHNMIDARSYPILEELGYKYDATTFENYGWFYPEATITEIPVSSFGLLPLEDYILVYALKMGDLGFFLMRQDKDSRISLDLHPQHVFSHRGAFQYVVSSYADDGVRFRTHADVATWNEELKKGSQVSVE